MLALDKFQNMLAIDRVQKLMLIKSQPSPDQQARWLAFSAWAPFSPETQSRLAQPPAYVLQSRHAQPEMVALKQTEQQYNYGAQDMVVDSEDKGTTSASSQ